MKSRNNARHVTPGAHGGLQQTHWDRSSSSQKAIEKSRIEHGDDCAVAASDNDDP